MRACTCFDLIVDLCVVSISGVKFRRYLPSFALIAQPASAEEGDFPRERSANYTRLSERGAFVKLEEEILSPKAPGTVRRRP